MNEFGIKIGDILYSSWGYEQTNICYYEVVKASAKFITVQQIEAHRIHNDNFGGWCKPMPGKFKGESLRRKVLDYSDSPFISINSSENARLWDGRPKSFTTYA